MRKNFAIPMIAAFALAACGSNADDATEASEAMSAEDVAGEMGSVETPIAGQYRTTPELLDINLPGAGAEFLEVLRSGFAEGAAEETTYCITEEQAANSCEEMLAQMAEGNCTVTRFDVEGSTVDAVMSCAPVWLSSVRHWRASAFIAIGGGVVPSEPGCAHGRARRVVGGGHGIAGLRGRLAGTRLGNQRTTRKQRSEHEEGCSAFHARDYP